MIISCILAVDLNFGISKDGIIPWNIPEDMSFFKEKTKHKIVVMGKNTYLSLPKGSRPLKNRLMNCIVSTTFEKELDDVEVFKSLEECLNKLENIYPTEEIFIIGGSRLYNEAFRLKQLNNVYFTFIKENFYTDNFVDKSFLKRPHNISNVTKSYYGKIEFTIDKIEIHNNSEEQQYLNMLKQIVSKPLRETRNANTYSDFGYTLKFNLENSFPMLTTKRVYWKGVAEELLFFLRGETDAGKLSTKNVKIWDPNTTREFLDKRGLNHYSVGDMGPMYGWNWRHFGAKYINKDTDYQGEGFDQLRDVIDKLTNDKTSRRIVMTAFDPSKVSEAVLPPCHSMVLQFYVEDDRLSLQMYQRSSDSFLGLPFNITQHSLLLYIMCEISNLRPDKLIIQLGDIHVYQSHLEAVEQQLKRCTYNFPKLEILKKYEGEIEDIDSKLKYIESLQFEDLKIIDYNCGSSIKADMIA